MIHGGPWKQKQRRQSQRVAMEGEEERFQGWEGLLRFCCLWRWRKKPQAQACSGLWKLGPALSSQPARTRGCQSNNHKELKSANNSKEQRNRPSPRASRKESGSVDTLIWAQWDACQTSDLQNCERIDTHRFKLLSLWGCVTAAVKNGYGGIYTGSWYSSRSLGIPWIRIFEWWRHTACVWIWALPASPLCFSSITCRNRKQQLHLVLRVLMRIHWEIPCSEPSTALGTS